MVLPFGIDIIAITYAFRIAGDDALHRRVAQIADAIKKHNVLRMRHNQEAITEG